MWGYIRLLFKSSKKNRSSVFQKVLPISESVTLFQEAKEPKKRLPETMFRFSLASEIGVLPYFFPIMNENVHVSPNVLIEDIS